MTLALSIKLYRVIFAFFLAKIICVLDLEVFGLLGPRWSDFQDPSRSFANQAGSEPQLHI